MNQETTPPTNSPFAGSTPSANTPNPGNHTSSEIDEVKRVASEKVHETMDDLKHGASEALDSAKEAGSTLIQDQKSKLAGVIEEYLHAMKAACESLEGEDHNPLVRPANRVVRHLEHATNYLRDTEPIDVLHDFGDIAKRRPEFVFGGLFLGGLALVRFLKASSRNAHCSSGGNNRKSDQAILQNEVPRYALSPDQSSGFGSSL